MAAPRRFWGCYVPTRGLAPHESDCGLPIAGPWVGGLSDVISCSAHGGSLLQSFVSVAVLLTMQLSMLVLVLVFVVVLVTGLLVTPI